MDLRPLIELHLVEDRPEWKVACGWGIMTRNGREMWTKILIPKSYVERLQRQLTQGEYPIEPVSKWQLRISIHDVGSLVAASLDQGGGAEQ